MEIRELLLGIVSITAYLLAVRLVSLVEGKDLFRLLCGEIFELHDLLVLMVARSRAAGDLPVGSVRGVILFISLRIYPLSRVNRSVYYSSR